MGTEVSRAKTGRAKDGWVRASNRGRSFLFRQSGRSRARLMCLIYSPERRAANQKGLHEARPWKRDGIPPRRDGLCRFARFFYGKTQRQDRTTCAPNSPPESAWPSRDLPSLNRAPRERRTRRLLFIACCSSLAVRRLPYTPLASTVHMDNNL